MHLPYLWVRGFCSFVHNVPYSIKKCTKILLPAHINQVSKDTIDRPYMCVTCMNAV